MYLFTEKYLFTNNLPGTVQVPGNKTVRIRMIATLMLFLILWIKEERKQANLNTRLSSIMKGRTGRAGGMEDGICQRSSSGNRGQRRHGMWSRHPMVVQLQVRQWAGSLCCMRGDDERSGWSANRAQSTRALVNHADKLGPWAQSRSIKRLQAGEQTWSYLRYLLLFPLTSGVEAVILEDSVQRFTFGNI